MAMKPPILNTGDTVGIVTLGSPLDPNTIQARIDTLNQMGFRVLVGRHAYDQTGFLAGSDEDRAGDLMAMFENDQVKMILPTRGGVGVAGVLRYLDFAAIRSHPKIITGYSDLTVLLNALYQYADLVTFHSLLLIDFRPDTPDYNYSQFFEATMSLTAPRPIANPVGMPMRGIVAGDVTGPIVGGNLTSLVGTLGTPYEIDTAGKILFLEETEEPINTVYRYLNHLKMAGKFDDCIGIIMGQCTNCAAAYGSTYDDLIRTFLVPFGKPLMANLASGHGYYKAAIPIGATVRMDARNHRLTVMEPTVSQTA